MRCVALHPVAGAESAAVAPQQQHQPAAAAEPTELLRECAVCLEMAQRMLVMVPCGHVFACDGCVANLAATAKLRNVQMKCAICREPVVTVVKFRQA